MNKIYVGTSLYNGDKAKHFISRFKDLGMAITYDWTTHGKVETVEELIEEVEMKTFYYLPNVHKFTTEEEAFNFVTERRK